MYEANCPQCGAYQQSDSTSLSVTCVRCGKEFNPKYPEGAPVKGFTKYDVGSRPAAETSSTSTGGSGKWTPMRKVSLALIPVLLVAFTFSAYRFLNVVADDEPDGPAGWHRYRDDNVGFTAWFPGAPTTTSGASIGLDGRPSTIHEVAWTSDGVTVEVVWTKLSVLADVNLQRFMELAANLLDVEMIDSKEVEHQGVPAMWGAGMTEEGEITMKVFETKHKLFILAISGPGDDWNKFSESFYLDKDQRTGPGLGE